MGMLSAIGCISADHVAFRRDPQRIHSDPATRGTARVSSQLRKNDYLVFDSEPIYHSRSVWCFSHCHLRSDEKKKKKWREGRFLPSSMSLPLCSLWEISETTSIHFPWQQQQLKYTRRVVVKGVVINFVEGFVHERELDWNWNSNFSIGFRPVRLDQFHLS